MSLRHFFRRSTTTEGPRGPEGMPGRDWSQLTPTWSPVAQVPDTTRPRPAHPGDAGADLYAYEQAVIPPHSMVKVRTGWSVSLRPDTVGDVRTRSSMATKGLVVANSPGTVDTGYNGEVLVALHNVTDRQQMVFRGDKIAQFVTLPVVCAGDPVNPADRADGGFGSTDTDVFMDRIRQTAQDLGEASPVTRIEVPPQEQWREAPWTDDQDDVDMVNHPPHYQNHDIFPGECIDYTESMTFTQGNAFKYVWRWNSKGDPLENLKKALFYCKHGVTLVNRRDNPVFWEEQHDTADRLSDALAGAERVAAASPEAGLSALELDVASSALYIVYGMPLSAQDTLDKAVAHYIASQLAG